MCNFHSSLCLSIPLSEAKSGSLALAIFTSVFCILCFTDFKQCQSARSEGKTQIWKDLLWNAETQRITLRDYVELWAGKWRPTDLWTLCNISNDRAQSREPEPREVSLHVTEHLGQTQEAFLWLPLRWSVAWHSVCAVPRQPVCPMGQCHSAETGAFLCFAPLGWWICTGEPVFTWTRFLGSLSSSHSVCWVWQENPSLVKFLCPLFVSACQG